MNAIEVEHFSKSYGKSSAVDDISFTVRQGDFFGFLGPNGAGKTTTIHCLTGISVPTKGNLRLFGHDVIHDYRAARKQVGFSPQEFNVDVWAHVERILWYMCGFYGIKTAERVVRIDEILAIFDLKSHARKPFRALSGGLKRRVMLARAMVHNPPLLILDEPTAGIDIELRHDLWKYLRRINEEGKTILLTSHYLEEVELLCGRIAIINKGKIVSIGDKNDFIDKDRRLEHTYLELIKRNRDE